MRTLLLCILSFQQCQILAPSQLCSRLLHKSGVSPRAGFCPRTGGLMAVSRRRSPHGGCSPASSPHFYRSSLHSSVSDGLNRRT